MFMLEANVLFIAKQVCALFLLFRSYNRVTLDSSNPGTPKHRHMSNRIYDTLDSEYRAYFFICSLVGTQKNRLKETLVFVYSNVYFCKTQNE